MSTISIPIPSLAKLVHLTETIRYAEGLATSQPIIGKRHIAKTKYKTGPIRPQDHFLRGKWKRRIRSDVDTDADADTDADTDTDTNQNSFFSPLQCRTEAKHGYSLAKSCLLSLLLASFPGSPTREQKFNSWAGPGNEASLLFHVLPRVSRGQRPRAYLMMKVRASISHHRW